MGNLEKFLQADKYVDYHSENIQQKAAELFSPDMSDVEKVKNAYKFVRDEINETPDIAED